MKFLGIHAAVLTGLGVLMFMGTVATTGPGRSQMHD